MVLSQPGGQPGQAYPGYGQPGTATYQVQQDGVYNNDREITTVQVFPINVSLQPVHSLFKFYLLLLK